ncbi:NYN domain-containing protein [Chitinibacter sp. S2-10]|uniref:NYN domain-containing protein n=1 Tax=Chitinibacter sp. S2-10 TaxID=3373597 RepID=UPI0039777189
MSKPNQKFEFKFEPENEHQKIAVLIDADNAQAKLINAILAEVGKYGVATVKRIYGDFTLPNLNSWKNVLLDNSILPMQQYAYTKGKNATDSALIIDAMDLLHTGRFDAFCLVSSDSDFTRLAARIRESGLTVYGIGRDTTPQPFKSACDKFISTEYLKTDEPELPVEQKNSEKISEKQTQQPLKKSDVIVKPEIVKLVSSAIEEMSDDQGFALISRLGDYLTKLQPDFDSRKYGHKKLSNLIKAYTDYFMISEREINQGSPKVMYVKNKS